MFSETQPEGRKRWDLSLLVSYAAHVAVLLAIGYRVAPVFVMPSEVALGTPGSSGTVTYLAPTGSERAQPPREKPELTMNPADAKLPVPPKPLPPAEQKSDAASDASIDKTTNGGSPYGSRIPGAPLTGHEIIPALPQVFPDPAVSRADLPAGVEGDVVVEVTIDEQTGEMSSGSS